MKQIWFKQKFYSLIAEGKKTQTIRIWKRKPNFKIGEEFECFFGYNHKKLSAKIKEIIVKNYDEITNEEMFQDGFVSKEELLINLKNFYSDFNKQTNLYLIKFDLKND
jgi:hypothetical protein